MFIKKTAIFKLFKEFGLKIFNQAEQKGFESINVAQMISIIRISCQ